MISSDCAAFSEGVCLHYDRVAETFKRDNAGQRGFYQELKHVLMRFIPQGQRVLDAGCGEGDLLEKLSPSRGVGIDISSRSIEYARRQFETHKHLEFKTGNMNAPEFFKDLQEQFDVILACNIVQELYDVNAFLSSLRFCCHKRTRLIIVNYSRLWQIPLKILEAAGLKRRPPVENWIPPAVMKEILEQSGFQTVREYGHLLLPLNLGFLSRWLNRWIGHLPLVEYLSLLRITVARPASSVQDEVSSQKPSCSVIIPCRNEEGHIPELARRVDENKLGPNSEVLWVEGNSKDNTEQAIKEQIQLRPARKWHFIKQTGKGKGDAVRLGFKHAQGDIFIILDADISVAPEELPKFVELLTSGYAEFVNGSRLVYPMEQKAMRFLNMLGNRFFAMLFHFLLGQRLDDTLCGTKVFWREDYDDIVAGRAYFGDFDPFGDFELLFGAARLNFKITNLQIRYGARAYGETNISRWTHGWLLLKMSWIAARKLKFI